MYYTTTGAYRRAKMIIDYVNIVLCAAVVIYVLAFLCLGVVR